MLVGDLPPGVSFGPEDLKDADFDPRAWDPETELPMLERYKTSARVVRFIHGRGPLRAAAAKIMLKVQR